MNKKILVNVGLPKTGTTFLGQLLHQLPSVSVSEIKEPTYLREFDKSNYKSQLLDKVIAHGNEDKNDQWFLRQFGDSPIMVDLSTQYWLGIRDLEGYELKKFIIYRDPFKQLVSYYKHLRRGYLPDEPLKEIVADDEKFGAYIKEMYEACNSVNDYSDTHLFQFDELIKEPLQFLENFMDWSEASYSLRDISSINTEIDRNSAGAPKFPLLNKFLMSPRLRSAKKIIPDSFYSSAVRTRKRIISMNLTEKNTGKSRYAMDEDIDFLRSYVDEG